MKRAILHATIIFAKNRIGMLQVNVLRNNPQWVKERLAVKNFKQLELVDEIIILDDERKRIQAQYDSKQSIINKSSKEIGKLMAQGKKQEVDEIKEGVAVLSEEN
ncbi:MAG TPA: hypothetical protein VHP12_08790, partial [Chitinophagaceae bacterium]|nr:hypothetical protein [Chitinophagaceae bacterium]